MNIILICGDHARNLYMIKYLLKIPSLNIKKIFLYERGNLVPSPPKNLPNDIKKLWEIHFKKREIAEKKFNFNIYDHCEDKIKKIKSLDEILENLQDLNELDACFISGTPIISEKILSKLPEYTINLHLGLIPHYKGAITMFWPFLNLEPTMAGTTFHVIDKFVDTGEIIHQNTPHLEKGDGMHDVAVKAMITACQEIDKIINFVNERIENKIKPIKDSSLKNKGKLFLKSDWKPEMLKIIYNKYDDKIVDLYLDGKIKSPTPVLKKVTI